MYGANKSLCQLLVELKNNHHIQPVVLLRLKGSIIKFLEENKIPYIISHYYWWVYEKKGLNARFQNIIKQIRNFYKLQSIYKKIGCNQFDLVYTNSITVNIGYFIARKYKCPHLWHIRESLEQFQFKFGMGKKFAQIFLTKAADRYILISDYLIRFYGRLLPDQKVIRIYNGIKPPVTKRERTKKNGTLNLCILGVVCHQKNQMDAVKALNRLVNNRSIKNIHLHIAGSAKADYLAELKNYIKSKGLKSYLTYYGHISDINHFLSTMDIGLVCARNEAFGRVTIEYMMSTIPVIASRSGANEELVVDGVNGTCYELNNTTDLADKIEILFQNHDQLSLLGNAAYEYAITHFSSKRNSSAIGGLITDVTSK